MPEQISEVVLLKDTIPFRTATATVIFVKITFWDNETKIKDTARLIPLLHEIILRMDEEIECSTDHVTKIEHVSNGN